jgi:hypothetical protein
MFQIGKLYHRKTELHDKYGGNRQAGIASSRSRPYIFLFSSPRGEEFGYKDGWISENEYRYTGEGQIGDMAMVRGNRAILEHVANCLQHIDKLTETQTAASVSHYRLRGQVEGLAQGITALQTEVARLAAVIDRLRPGGTQDSETPS